MSNFDSVIGSPPDTDVPASADILAATTNILFLHSENRDRFPHRTRSGSLIPENSPRSEQDTMSTPTKKKEDGDLNEMEENKVRADKRQIEVMHQITELENLAFLLISFGYMVPWTSLGSLISYFKHTYNANFYNKLYCAYYLPGLPVAILQHKYDGFIDGYMGSRAAYMLRGVVSFLIMIAILVSMIWWREQETLILLFTLLGIFSWLCHGTASMLASMYPATAIAYLQTGFRCPEIYTIAIVAALNIGSHPSDHDLDLFFACTAVVVALSSIVWVLIASSSSARRFLDLKDHRMTAHLLPSDPAENIENEPLLNNASNDPASRRYNALGRFVVRNDSESDLSRSIEPSTSTEISQIRDRRKHASHQLKSKIVLRAIEDASMRNTVYRKVFSLCLALFITIWCSIFQASFFAYCDSPQGRDIEQILYFVRLFSDLLGRPLTRLPRPWFLQENHHVLHASILRTALMVLFFCYIFIPEGIFPRSDLFISFIVAVFSALSGYLTVLIYEYAAEGLDGAAQTYATGLLNMSFQLAAFTAVLLSVLITSTGWIETVTGG